MKKYTISREGYYYLNKVAISKRLSIFPLSLKEVLIYKLYYYKL